MWSFRDAHPPRPARRGRRLADPAAPRGRRVALVLLAAAPLAACGFTPVYGPGGPLQGLRGQIRADDPTDRNGYVFVQRLEDKLGLPVSAPYGLGYRIKTERQGLGVNAADDTTRFHLLGRADYTVTERDTGKVLAEGKVENFTAYSATGSIVGTISADEDAAERLMVILADQLVTELVATAADWRR